MEFTLSVLALVVAAMALLVALLTHAKVGEKEENDNPSTALYTREATTPPSADADTSPDKGRQGRAVSMSVEERRERAILQKQYDNFMNYDGSEQNPIDPDTILADSGE